LSSPYPRHRLVSTAEAVAADRDAIASGVPQVVLMEHAGRGLAALVADLLPPGGTAAVLCGPGNNGGDGYACARFLRGWGVPVRVVRCAPGPPTGTAGLEHELVAREQEIQVAASLSDARVLDVALDGAAVLVDALFGVGLSRPLAPPYDAFIERIDRASGVRVAADVPSGLSSDDGLPLPVAVHAHVTAAMGFVKRGCASPEGARHCGRIVEIDVGLPGAIHRRHLA
jgi:NAD(P)H-hydrate epimerase